jgi:hypothetical protein
VIRVEAGFELSNGDHRETHDVSDKYSDILHPELSLLYSGDVDVAMFACLYIRVVLPNTHPVTCTRSI